MSGAHRICTVNAKKRPMNAPSHNSCKNAFKLRSRLLEPSHRRPATLRTSRSSPRMPCRSAPWSRPLVNVCHYGHRRRSPPFRVAFSHRAGCSERERERERQTGVRVRRIYEQDAHAHFVKLLVKTGIAVIVPVRGLELARRARHRLGASLTSTWKWSFLPLRARCQ